MLSNISQAGIWRFSSKESPDIDFHIISLSNVKRTSYVFWLSSHILVLKPCIPFLNSRNLRIATWFLSNRNNYPNKCVKLVCSLKGRFPADTGDCSSWYVWLLSCRQLQGHKKKHIESDFQPQPDWGHAQMWQSDGGHLEWNLLK